MSLALPAARRALPAVQNFLSISSSTFRSTLPSTSSLPTRAPSLSFAPIAFTTLPLPAAFQLPSLASLFPDSLEALRELLPPWVLAVPKSKTSHSKKSMRSSGKGLKEQQGAFVRLEGAQGKEELMRFPLRAAIVACPSCGTPKRAHHICHECHVDFRREYHQEAKLEAAEAKKEV